MDGKSVGPTKLFPYPQNNWVLCEWNTPSDGDHTVSAKVTSNGQAFWVDRIAYIPGEDVELDAATISVGRLDPAISFDAGQWRPLGDIGTMTQVTGAAVRFKFQGELLVHPRRADLIIYRLSSYMARHDPHRITPQLDNRDLLDGRSS